MCEESTAPVKITSPSKASQKCDHWYLRERVRHESEICGTAYFLCKRQSCERGEKWPHTHDKCNRDSRVFQPSEPYDFLAVIWIIAPMQWKVILIHLLPAAFLVNARPDEYVHAAYAVPIDVH